MAMMNAGEQVLTCPYNKAHSIIKSRMQFHLAKCRLQSPNSEKVVCPYNSTHIVAKVELEFHQQVCESRIVLDSFIYDVGSSKCPVEDVPVNVPPEALAPCEEDWDEDPAVSVLDGLKQSVKEKNVLLNLIGAPKAERKAHRQQERLRYQRVVDSKENENKKKNENRKKNAEAKKNEAPAKIKTPEPVSVKEKVLTEAILPSKKDDNKKEEIVNNEDKFEVVKYHKKAQHGKKNKQNQQQQHEVLRPPQKSSKGLGSEGEEIMIKLTKLKCDNKQNGEGDHRDRSPPLLTQQQRGRQGSEMNLTRNAWEKPLNMGVRANNKSRSPPEHHPFDEFPSLPVSGRGRAVFLKY